MIWFLFKALSFPHLVSRLMLKSFLIFTRFLLALNHSLSKEDLPLKHEKLLSIISRKDKSSLRTTLNNPSLWFILRELKVMDSIFYLSKEVLLLEWRQSDPSASNITMKISSINPNGTVLLSSVILTWCYVRFHTLLQPPFYLL